MRDGEQRSRKFAKQLRKNLTDAETILWSRLRRDRVHGRRFRKQHPIGPYIADFACVPAMLVVEVDGATHGTDAQVEHDARRTALFRQCGWREIRVTNRDVYESSEPVLDFIWSEVAQRVRQSSRSENQGRD